MTRRFSAFSPLTAPLLAFFAFFGELFGLLWESLLYIARGAISYRHTVRQMAVIGVDSLLVAIITVGFSGAVAALNLSLALTQYGQGSYVGLFVGKSLALEVAPVITAVVIAARAGSAMAAELGSMVVTEQVDALRSLATSPTQYLVVPRVLGTLIMLPLITVLAGVAGAIGGAIAAQANGVPYASYWQSLQNLDIRDPISGLIKTIPFALIIALVGCHQGLTTKGGAAGVGRATTSAVVFALIGIFVADFFLAVLLQDVSAFKF